MFSEAPSCKQELFLSCCDSCPASYSTPNNNQKPTRKAAPATPAVKSSQHNSSAMKELHRVKKNRVGKATNCSSKNDIVDMGKHSTNISC